MRSVLVAVLVAGCASHDEPARKPYCVRLPPDDAQCSKIFHPRDFAWLCSNRDDEAAFSDLMPPPPMECRHLATQDQPIACCTTDKAP